MQPQDHNLLWKEGTDGSYTQITIKRCSSELCWKPLTEGNKHASETKTLLQIHHKSLLNQPWISQQLQTTCTDLVLPSIYFFLHFMGGSSAFPLLMRRGSSQTSATKSQLCCIHVHIPFWGGKGRRELTMCPACPRSGASGAHREGTCSSCTTYGSFECYKDKSSHHKMIYLKKMIFHRSRKYILVCGRTILEPLIWFHNTGLRSFQQNKSSFPNPLDSAPLQASLSNIVGFPALY